MSCLALRRRVSRPGNDWRLLVRLERSLQKSRRVTLVLDLVYPHPLAIGGHFLQRSFVDPHAAGTNLDAARPRCASAFHLLAPGLLGMDGGGRGVRFSLCGSFSVACASKR
jgi:hypothetical protein